MKTLLTKGIVLSRTDFGEADRIVTTLTPDMGKLRLMARGVRKIKSKLAGAIELFSISEISYIKGKGDIDTLISARLIKYYSHIVEDIERVQLGYEFIKMLNRATEDEPETEYFDLLDISFQSLDDKTIPLELIKLWVQSQLLSQAGHSPNLVTDTNGDNLSADQKYNFDYDQVAFAPHETGHFAADHIKLLRICFSANPPKVINQVQGIDKLLPTCLPLVQTMLQTYIRL